MNEDNYYPDPMTFLLRTPKWRAMTEEQRELHSVEYDGYLATDGRWSYVMTIDPGGAEITCTRSGWKTLVFRMDTSVG